MEKTREFYSFGLDDIEIELPRPSDDLNFKQVLVEYEHTLTIR